MQKIFADARSTLEKNLSNEFAEKCYAYSMTTLNYNKNPTVNLDVSSVIEESFMMVYTQLSSHSKLKLYNY